jgi:hypothetical protein
MERLRVFFGPIAAAAMVFRCTGVPAAIAAGNDALARVVVLGELG